MSFKLSNVQSEFKFPKSFCNFIFTILHLIYPNQDPNLVDRYLKSLNNSSSSLFFLPLIY